MRLKVSLFKEIHTEIVTCVGWLNADELFSAGDDHKVVKSQISGESSLAVQLGQECFATDIHWFPKGASSKKAGNEIFALASTEGKLYFISKSGRIEKTVDAHRGALLSCRWNYDGNAIITGGEDGQVKVWSSSGMLRSTLLTLAVSVYSVVWSPNSDAILCTNGKQLMIKPLQPSGKVTQWKAHEGIILKVDWNTTNNTLISGAEDCKYKVWDMFGRNLFTSIVHEYPITSVSWAPDGDFFAVGSYNTLRLCDKAGWSHTLEKPTCGSLFNIAWSSDGTQLAGACGNANLLVAQVVERSVEWKNLECVVSDQKHVKVRDVITDARENLDFRDRVVKLALSYDHLVVTTPSQCYIFSTKNWNTPMIFDFKGSSVSLVMLAEKHFLVADETGVQIYSYEGRVISTPRYSNLRGDLLNKNVVSLCNDTLAIRDRTDECAIYFFEALTGKPLGDGKPFRHNVDILHISLNQDGASSERQLAFIDKNKDLFLRPVRQFGSEKVVKIAGNVSSLCWNNSCNILATVSDHKLFVWYNPGVVYVDSDLMKMTILETEPAEFGRDIQLLNFVGTYCTMRRGDGALCSTSVSPYPAFLHKFVNKNSWNEAIRLCRFVKDKTLWACLAGFAALHKDLNTAEIAYAAIDEIEKVHFIQAIKEIPSAEGRNAAVLLFCGQVKDAELILLQSGLIYRAIQMHIDQFNWERALELAVKHKTHVDTVLAYRQKYLQRCNKKENNKKFIQFAQGVTVDWEKIKLKIEMEIEKESERPGAKVSGQ
ncbi:intraflagellar transport protein 80 homolog isoform X1 [Hydra vulgaris]|uniref:intraflagellar transport protein 80 homolog isoform X2 n=2 Tax=Hydra vulgaris TaxID=6087 RepID=UPI0032EA7602